MAEVSSSPEQVYRRRLGARSASAEHYRRRDAQLSWVRLGLFAATLALAWLTLFREALHPTWLLLPAALFIALLFIHDRVIGRRTRAMRAAAFYELGLARLEDRWAGRGKPGTVYLDPRHPYAADLDIFGLGSLFELVCTARTSCGERVLARWLSEPAAPDEIMSRQEAVRELRPMADLREDLAIAGEEASGGLDPDDLLDWSRGEPQLVHRWPLVLARVLAATNVVTFLAWAWSAVGALIGAESVPELPATPFLVSALLSGILGFALRDRVGRVLAAVERPERELELLSLVLARLERERFRAPLLARLRGGLDCEGSPPSRRIARLARLVQVNESRANMMFAPIAALTLLGTRSAFAMERWRAASGDAVARWLDAVGKIEALCALAGFAYEHPSDPFPEIATDGPCFEGTGLGHPLLSETASVTNDVRLTAQRQLLLVSGSNMSGKSTLLRTVGVNAVLALAGAPVRATALRLSPLAIGACMRVQDSLREGLSHFYAEIKRLRELVRLGEGPLPLLFLLDEILHGTNSHDRRIGAEALIRGLLAHGGLGLVTTHDLALARIAQELAPRADNVHFADRLEGERIVFDYRLRPGVVERSNAIGLMRAVGLEV